MKRMGTIFLFLLIAGSLHATSHCYKQRSNCFEEKDGKEAVKMYIKRDRFVKAAQKQGLSKKRIDAMIKKGEGYDEGQRGEDLRDERGYYGGVYWPHPIYAYPPYWHDHPHHDHPHHPGEKPPGQRPPGQKPPKHPVTIQPTENPFFDRPRPERPSTQPVQRPATRPVTKPSVRPTRPAARPRPAPRPRPRPRPRPMRRAR